MANTLVFLRNNEELRANFELYQKIGTPQGKGIKFTELDKILRWDTGQLSIITGIPNHGKSEFLDFVCVQLAKNYGWKTVMFSPENNPINFHIEKLYNKVINKNSNGENSDKEKDEALTFILNNFYFFDYEQENVSDLGNILDATKELIQLDNNVKILVIDAFYNLDITQENNQSDLAYILAQLKKLKQFAKENNILIQLVAHTRKILSDGNGKYKVPNFFDINGSADFAKVADYCLTVYRNKDSKETEIHVAKVRFKNYGTQGQVNLMYDDESGNYYEVNSNLDAILGDFDIKERNELDKELGKTSKNFLNEGIKKELKELKNRNVLNVTVSFYDNVFSKNKANDANGANDAKDVNLYEYLKTKNDNINLDDMRAKENFADLKKTLPITTISGTFDGGHKNENLLNHSGLICLDIDKKDNLERDMNDIKEELKQLPYVCYIGKSCGGEGLYAIVPIQDPNKHEEHFNALEKDFALRGIVLDTKCKNVSRARFYSYDDEAYFNEKANPYIKQLTKKNKTQKPNNNNNKHSFNNDAKQDNDNLVTQIYDVQDEQFYIDGKSLSEVIQDICDNNIIIAPNYGDWRNLAIFFKSFGEEGRDLFHKISSQDKTEYTFERANKEFDNMIKYDYDGVHFCTFKMLYTDAKNELIANNKK
jgi:hypothetical protein